MIITISFTTSMYGPMHRTHFQLLLGRYLLVSVFILYKCVLLSILLIGIVSSTTILYAGELMYLAKKTNALRIFTIFVDQSHSLSKLSHLGLPNHDEATLVRSV